MKGTWQHIDTMSSNGNSSSSGNGNDIGPPCASHEEETAPRRNMPTTSSGTARGHSVITGMPVLESQTVDDDDDRQMLVDEILYLREELEHGLFIPDGAHVPGNQATTSGDAAMVDDPITTERRRRRRFSILILLILVIIVVAVVLGVVLGSKDGGDATDENSHLPVEELVRSAALDGGKSLDDPNSPQSKALEWLQNNTFLANYSDWQRIQRYALATLYFSTNGDHWHENSRWLSNEDCCSWYNMNIRRCDDWGNLVKLTLESNNMNGTIPPELGLLSDSLVRAAFVDNSLAGTIPSEIGLMRRLEQLFLSSNHLTGTMPSEIGKLSNMKELFFDRNTLTGHIPSQIGLMSNNLGRLLLGTNSISGTIPSHIGLLNELQFLRIGENKFTGTIPSEIGVLTKRFAWLDINSCALNGTIPNEISTLVELAKIILHDNSLTGTIPEGIERLPELRELKLYNNNLSGNYTCPSTIGLCWISCDNSSMVCRSL